MGTTVLVRRTLNDRVNCVFSDYGGGYTTYKLAAPWPTPGKLAWRVAIRDAHTGDTLEADHRTATVRAVFGSEASFVLL